LLGRPTYLLADLRFTMILLPSFLIRYPPSLLNGTQLKQPTGNILRSKCNFKMHVRNLGYPLCYSTNWGPHNHLFSTTSHFTA